MKHQQRFYINFLAGPTSLSFLNIAWINFALCLIFYWIIASYFDNPLLVNIFIVAIIFSMGTMIYHRIKAISHRYLKLSMIIVCLQIILMLCLIDFMSLLMFLSSYGRETEITLNNKPLIYFILIIGSIWVLSMIYFVHLYRIERQPFVLLKRCLPKASNHMTKYIWYLVCIFIFVSMLFQQTIFIAALALAMLCTFIFSALIIDAFCAFLNI
ncbi:hypothetical protein OCL94_07705 [Macrococcus sp. TMW 2.2395]|nr:hypothetical protein [Macrococcus sp. TMW 2.2395]